MRIICDTDNQTWVQAEWSDGPGTGNSKNIATEMPEEILTAFLTFLDWAGTEHEPKLRMELATYETVRQAKTQIEKLQARIAELTRK